MIPVWICLFKKALVRVCLITIVFVVVTLLGLLIRSIKLFWKGKLKTFFTFTLFS